MDDEGRRPPPFDERAALEELERFREGIVRARAQRAASEDEFEMFVRSFKRTGAEDGVSADASQSPTRAAQEIPLSAGPPEPSAILLPTDHASAPSLSRDGTAEPAQTDPVAPARPPAARSSSSSTASSWAPVLLGGALIMLVAGGLLVNMLGNRGSEPASPAPNTSEAPAAPRPLPATPPPSSAAVTDSSSESAITTTRRVWMRVTVDGVRVVERELPAGTRLPLKAEESIVIRTGDAGAVRLSIRGQDRGFLGAEGEVVTRSFPVPPRTVPAVR